MNIGGLLAVAMGVVALGFAVSWAALRRTDDFEPVRRQPLPPVNIQIHTLGGKHVPADARYIGDNEDGLHVWEVLTPVREGEVERVTIDEMPPETMICFPVES
jgi:hypothetical protein